MGSFIYGFGTAVPIHYLPQELAYEKTLNIFSFTEEQKVTLKKLYQNSAINKRHVVLEDFMLDRSQWNFWGSDYPKSIPGMTKRNEIYKKESPLLAHEASVKAIQAWGGDASSITHVISVSCTGVVIPGIEFSLINSLGLNRSVTRLGINFTGCFGAFKGLEVANAFALANPNNRILVVCTELCSLHLQDDGSQDTMLANSIFADGSAAVIVGGSLKGNETPIWEIVKHLAKAIENTENLMSWEASDRGYMMKLSGFVPLSLSRYIQSFSAALLDVYTDVSSCDWAIHPGGKAILQVIEKKLSLNKDQTVSSWETLADFGNMSSATFLFVLDKLVAKKSSREWVAGLGFGPGLSVEGVLLKKYSEISAKV